MQLLIISICLLISGSADCRTTYDQSQTGEFNVQVDLKDLEIIALLNGKNEEYYEDIDYAYDYSEMTIKPPSGTSKKPLNVTTVADNITDNATIATTVYNEQTTESIKNSTWENTEKLNVTQHAIVTESAAEGEITTKTLNLAESNISQFNNSNEFVTVKNDVVTIKYVNSEDGTLSAQSQAQTQSTLHNEYNTTSGSVLEVNTKPSSPVPANSTSCKKGFIINQKGGCDFKLQSMSNALLKIVKLSQKLKSRRHHHRQNAHGIV